MWVSFNMDKSKTEAQEMESSQTLRSTKDSKTLQQQEDSFPFSKGMFNSSKTELKCAIPKETTKPHYCNEQHYS